MGYSIVAIESEINKDLFINEFNKYYFINKDNLLIVIYLNNRKFTKNNDTRICSKLLSEWFKFLEDSLHELGKIVNLFGRTDNCEINVNNGNLQYSYLFFIAIIPKEHEEKIKQNYTLISKENIDYNNFFLKEEVK